MFFSTPFKNVEKVTLPGGGGGVKNPAVLVCGTDTCKIKILGNNDLGAKKYFAQEWFRTSREPNIMIFYL